MCVTKTGWLLIPIFPGTRGQILQLHGVLAPYWHSSLTLRLPRSCLRARQSSGGCLRFFLHKSLRSSFLSSQMRIPVSILRQFNNFPGPIWTRMCAFSVCFGSGQASNAAAFSYLPPQRHFSRYTCDGNAHVFLSVTIPYPYFDRRICRNHLESNT